MSSLRKEYDTIGSIDVANDKYWGAQTQRSLQNFAIGHEKMPKEVIASLVLIKRCAALTNKAIGKLSSDIAETIVEATNKILPKGILDGIRMTDQFPLSVWQTGSGTQSNMNVNEVLANLANTSLGEQLGSKKPVHPNDHVNMSQSSNDTFPTAMHIASYVTVKEKLLKSCVKLHKSLLKKQREFAKICKIGRTHMQDATPITLGQEFSGYASQIQYSIERISSSITDLLFLAQGGTAVGTGINCPDNFSEIFVSKVVEFTGYNFISSPNKFESLASSDSLVNVSGSINTLAVSIMKIANDIRLMGSGPRCGIGELILPMNEPGSSIMPGKVNPTQCEAITMVCSKVMGNHTTITIAGSQGHLELNVFRPVMIYSLLQSINIMSDAINSFVDHCLEGIKANSKRISHFLSESLMLVTALNPHIGYDKAAKIAKLAYENNLSLKSAALQSGYVTQEEFDSWVDPNKMI